MMAEAAAMISAGFSVAAEPYLKSALVCLRAHLLHVRPSAFIVLILPMVHNTMLGCSSSSEGMTIVPITTCTEPSAVLSVSRPVPAAAPSKSAADGRYGCSVRDNLL